MAKFTGQLLGILNGNENWVKKQGGILSASRAHTHTRLTAIFSGTTQVSQYLKGKTDLDFTEARDSERQWHQLDRMQVCASLQSDNHASTPPLSFLQAGCPSCHPTNSVKALKAFACQVIPIRHFRAAFGRRWERSGITPGCLSESRMRKVPRGLSVAASSLSTSFLLSWPWNQSCFDCGPL